MNRKQALILLGIATIAFTVILELVDPSRVSHGPTIPAELELSDPSGSRRSTITLAKSPCAGKAARHVSRCEEARCV
jgi:hypothetical protein